MRPHRTLGFRRIAIGALLFSSGVLASNRVKHFIATVRDGPAAPYVEVLYRREGAYINRELYEPGRMSGPRCDWKELSLAQRLGYVSSAVRDEPGMLAAATKDLSSDKQRELAYLSLVHLARSAGASVADEVNALKDHYGVRWSLTYQKADAPLQP